jgi:outer membrane protein assembly factor BamB
MAGRATTGGLARVDADPATGECTVGWTSAEIAPTSVAKVSLATGLVYAYTKPRSPWGAGAWYLTALDARTGRTVWAVRTGLGAAFNNHYAAIALAPDGSAYVATLAGLVHVRDTR